jgi:hypothetical protein
MYPIDAIKVCGAQPPSSIFMLTTHLPPDSDAGSKLDDDLQWRHPGYIQDGKRRGSSKPVARHVQRGRRSW